MVTNSTTVWFTFYSECNPVWQ